jgi:hypothetical protein
MSIRSAPTLSIWLLRRCGVSESLIGDLIERYQLRRSRSWYWRQVLLSIVATSLQEIRAHKLLALRGVAVGIAVAWFLIQVTAPARIWIWKWVWNWTVENDLDAVRLILFSPSRLILQFGVPGLALLIAGWVIARTHGPRGIALVVAFAATLELCYVASMAWSYGLAPSAALRRPSISEFVAINGTWVLLTAIWPIVGGLWGAGVERDPSARPPRIQELACGPPWLTRPRTLRRASLSDSE